MIELKGVLCLEIIQKLLGEGKTFPWDRVKRALKGHRDILLKSGLKVSKLFLFKCLSNLLLNTAVPNFHGGSVLLPGSPCCYKAVLHISSRGQNKILSMPSLHDCKKPKIFKPTEK